MRQFESEDKLPQSYGNSRMTAPSGREPFKASLFEGGVNEVDRRSFIKILCLLIETVAKCGSFLMQD